MKSQRMHIAFITSTYPTPSRPYGGTFVQQFIWALARQGHKCSVIGPANIFDRRYGSLPVKFATEDAGAGRPVDIYRPRFFSLSSRKLGCFHTGRWSNAMFSRVALKAMARLQQRPDIVYGHFMYPAGHAAVCGALKMGVPSIVGVGEGEFWTIESVGYRRASWQMRDASAFLAVSTCIANELMARLDIPPEKVVVLPNGVDLGCFRPRDDRQGLCGKMGIPADTFNVGYVGPFIAKKGYPQLRAAVKEMEGIKLVLLGRGPLPPSDPQIAFAGTVVHKDVADYLGTCDAFVLPTAIEGSCNAVIEAMACGLPIVTSNGRYMDDIVDDEVAIRVNPADVGAIRAAIVALKDDPERRRKMSEACLRMAQKLDINERARRVTAWMKELVGSALTHG
jgi:glycosyltransferase involved in cell wall biosynthesis